MPEAGKVVHCRGAMIRVWANAGRETQGSPAAWKDDWDEMEKEAEKEDKKRGSREEDEEDRPKKKRK